MINFDQYQFLSTHIGGESSFNLLTIAFEFFCLCEESKCFSRSDMIRTICSGALTLVCGTAAVAADLPVRTYSNEAAYATPAYSWTGFYVGANIGGAWANNDTGFSLVGVGGIGPFTRGNDTTAFIGGGEVGVDYQFASNWLVGIEASLEGGNFHRSYSDSAGDTIGEKSGWIGSVTGRLGYTWGPGLIYGKGGVSFRNNQLPAVAFGFVATPFTSSQQTTGYVVGGGFEYMFAPSWSAKVEYNHYDFGNSNYNVAAFAPVPFSIKSSASALTIGANYHFNSIGWVAAKY